MKIGPAVRPGCRIEKKGKDRTGQDSQKKSQGGNISPIWGEAPTVPIETKICMAGRLADVITCEKFQDEIFRGYDFTGGRISHFPIDFCMGLTTVQRDCAACDDKSKFSSVSVKLTQFCKEVKHQNLQPKVQLTMLKASCQGCPY